MYHTQFGVPLGIAPGWWDDRKRNNKPVLPLYLCLNISNNLSRAVDCPHEHLVSLRTQHRQLVFPPQYEDSPSRLRTFLNQPDMYGVASFTCG
jgi:hypothetical protein